MCVCYFIESSASSDHPRICSPRKWRLRNYYFDHQVVGEVVGQQAHTCEVSTVQTATSIDKWQPPLKQHTSTRETGAAGWAGWTAQVRITSLVVWVRPQTSKDDFQSIRWFLDGWRAFSWMENTWMEGMTTQSLKLCSKNDACGMKPWWALL